MRERASERAKGASADQPLSQIQLLEAGLSAVLEAVLKSLVLKSHLVLKSLFIIIKSYFLLKSTNGEHTNRSCLVEQEPPVPKLSGRVPCSDSQGANGSGICCLQFPSGAEAQYKLDATGTIF